MKITKRTRIKVKWDIYKVLNINWWDQRALKSIMINAFGMTWTSKRDFFHYFHPTDEKKLSLFLLKYGDYVKTSS